MPLQLRLIFLLITLFLTFNYGWEFAIGGVIFLIVFNDSDYWLLLAGPILDLTFPFPFIFFTLTICAIIALSSATKNFFKEENFSSFAAKFIMLICAAALIISAYFIKDMDITRAMSFTYTFLNKTILEIAAFALLLKLAKYGNLFEKTRQIPHFRT